MSGTQILRIESRPRFDGALVGHHAGRTRPDSARDVDGAVVCIGPERLDDARRVIAAERDTPRQGRRGHEVVDVMIAGPPNFDALDAWSLERIERWAHRSADWLRAFCGHTAILAGCWLHSDEAAPHLHALIVPVADSGRLSFKAVRDAAVRRMVAELEEHGHSPRRKGRRFSWADTFGVCQDHFHCTVAAEFDLARGEVGSTRRHRAPTRAAGLEARARIEEHSARTAAKALRDQARQAAEASEAANELLVAKLGEHSEADAALAARRAELSEANAALAARRAELDDTTAYLVRLREARDAAEAAALVKSEQAERRRRERGGAER